MSWTPRRKLFPIALSVAVALLVVAGAWLVGCRSGGTAPAAVVAGDADSVIAARGLTPADVYAAVKTYQPSGKKDDYVLFASGGHSGQVLAVGVPSMRLLKLIGVFTPEPWQGWGYDRDTRKVLAEGDVDGRRITWGDTHHPALSETAGD